MSLLVVGSVAYDDVETPTAKQDDLLGGSATYFSMSAARFASPRLVGVVGRDFKDSDRRLLADAGTDLTGLVLDNTGDTFRWGGRYHENMNDRTSLYTYLNVFQTFRPTIPAAWTDSKYLFLGNIDPELQLNVLSQLQPRFVALDTMNFWIDGKRDALAAVLSKVGGLIVNDEEGKLLTGEHSILAMGKALQKLGPRTVVVKRGEYGALLFHDDDIFFVPGYPLEDVVDPTGAGDTFAGGFMGWIARQDDMSVDTLRTAMVVGSIMASYCVEGFGVTRVAAITQADIQTRHDSFVKLTRCPALTL